MVQSKPPQQSGEHAISLDGLIRRSFERAFETELQSTSRISRFELDEVLASPEVRPTAPPLVDGAIELTSLPPPAIEIDQPLDIEQVVVIDVDHTKE